MVILLTAFYSGLESETLNLEPQNCRNRNKRVMERRNNEQMSLEYLYRCNECHINSFHNPLVYVPRPITF